MATVGYQSRLLPFGGLVYQSVDLFDLDGYTRIPGVVAGDLSLVGLFQGSALVWPLTSGDGVTDAQVISGLVYWTEVASGRYLLRWRPTVPGAWSWTLQYPTVPQTLGFTYDLVSSLTPAPSPGIFPRFVP